MYDSYAVKILFNHWKMKNPHHSLPKPTAETFFFVLKLLCYPILRPKFWTSWDYSSIHTSFHSVFLQTDITIKCHHTPLAHALGYTEKEHKKRAAARITVHLLIPNFWARKSNVLTWGLCIFVEWKIISHFCQCYQNTLIHRPKADEL